MRVQLFGLAVIGFGVLLIVLFMSVVWIMGVKSQTPRRVPIEATPSGAFESIQFHGTSRLVGWLLWPSSNSTAESQGGQDALDSQDSQGRLPVIIVSHGWASNRSRVLRYVEPLREAGYAVVVYDVTSHGDSGAVRAPSALLFRDDLLAAVRYVKNRSELDPVRIGVLGHSLGGFGSVLALDEGLAVQAVVTDSMPSKPFTMIAAELKRRKLPVFPLASLIPRIWLIRARVSKSDYDAINICETIQRNAKRHSGRIPLLMIHSLGDQFIPPSELRDIINDLHEEQPHLFVDTDGHSCSQQDTRFWETVLPFFNRHVYQAGNLDTE